uniref:Reverse transcriptase domain-containing protein n=1 Tax=Octopus bimaculoides TaxID=37653 RepID=A0A0L8HFH9_OCTBM
MVCFGSKVSLVRLFGAPSWYHNVIQFRLKSVSVTTAPAQWPVTTITKRWHKARNFGGGGQSIRSTQYTTGRAVQALYRDAVSKVRVDNEYNEEFWVGVGVHQGSVLSPLLFIIILQAITEEFKSGCHWELLYADDLALIAESLSELEEKFQVWKQRLELKGLRVNLAKTKVLISRKADKPQIPSGRWPCSICRKDVGKNSIRCTQCKLWTHKRCNNIKGRLTGKIVFVCGKCSGAINTRNVQRTASVTFQGEKLEVVDSFRYLGDQVSSGSGSESVAARIRIAWEKFRELLPLLVTKGLSLRVKGRLYDACVRTAMLHGSETWAVTAEDMHKLARNEASILYWMCNVSVHTQQYHQPHPPDTVSPPGKLKRYLVDNCVRFAESYERFLEKRYPKVFEVYRMFKVGIRDFIADTRMYYNVTTELWTGKSLNCFSRKELEIYKQYPKDVWKVSPTLIISALPFANYVVFPIAYMYPKWFLSPHFWSDKHKEMIWGDILAKRMSHCSPVIYYLGSQCRHMDEDNPLKEKLQLAISKLKQTHQLTVDEILTLKPLFEDYPCHINKISIAYLRQLAMCNGLSMRRSKLVDDTLLLHYIDLAIGREGIENLSSQDLSKACYDRFLNPVGVPHKEQLRHLCQWLEISKEVDGLFIYSSVD